MAAGFCEAIPGVGTLMYRVRVRSKSETDDNIRNIFNGEEKKPESFLFDGKFIPYPSLVESHTFRVMSEGYTVDEKPDNEEPDVVQTSNVAQTINKNLNPRIQEVFAPISPEVQGPTPSVVQKVEKPNSLHEQIMDALPADMIDALGGKENVSKIPIIEDWGGSIELEDLKSPIMLGLHKDGQPFILFCYMKYNPEFNSTSLTGEYIGKDRNESWEGAYAYPSELNLRTANPIKKDDESRPYMLDKIKRAVNREPVGVLKPFPGNRLRRKAEDIQEWMPKDAYLDRKELESFGLFDTLFYERKPPEGKTDLFLYDPSKTKKWNQQEYEKYFPNA